MSALRRLTLPIFLFTTGALLTGCGSKPDPAAAATRFFELIGQGKAQQAYESAAFTFQAQQSEKVFAQTAKEMGLTQFASAKWETPEITGKTAKLRGEISTTKEAKIPLVVTLNEESGSWRVFSLRSPRDVQTGRAENRFTLIGKPPAFNDALSQPMPNEAAIKALTRETMARFNEAIQQQSFTGFYQRVSRSWQKQLTEGQLQRAFQPFIDNKIDLSQVQELEPVFTEPPHITTEGLLLVTGTYATTPYKTVFMLKYIYELPRWQLFGIDIRLEKPKADAPAASAPKS